MLTVLQRTVAVGQQLDQLFPDPKLSLNFYSPFTLLTAVLLSAQCTDERVNKATAGLFACADTPEKMDKLSQEQIFAHICGLGLAKNKSKYLKNMCRQLLDKFNGEVPANFSDLESLSGVGHKTASVVMIQAFGRPAFPVDTHILRLSKRWGLSQGTTPQQVENDLKQLFPPEEWGRRHLQFIECGRRYCKAVSHNLQLCPVCSHLQKMETELGMGK
ncbi:MAG: endonuclease III domain-containing protein [Candidatus Bruticola sp.]